MDREKEKDLMGKCPKCGFLYGLKKNYGLCDVCASQEPFKTLLERAKKWADMEVKVVEEFKGLDIRVPRQYEDIWDLGPG